MAPTLLKVASKCKKGFSPESCLQDWVLLSYKSKDSWSQEFDVILNNFSRHFSYESGHKLKAGSLDSTFILWLQKAPQVWCFSFSFLLGRVVLIQLKVVEKLLLVVLLFISIPFLYKAKAVSQCCKDSARHSIEDLFVGLFLVACGCIVSLLELLIAKM